jgi:hypothetical protein
MEYRSSNPEGHVHFGGDVMSGANSSRGVLLSSNTIQPVSDNSNEDLVIRGKGTGKVFIGNSTTPFSLVFGESTYTPPALAANAQGECTFAAAGISTGDLIVTVDLRNGLSTAYLPGLPYVGAADKIHVPVGNVHASTISGSTSLVVRWAYLDRT